MPETILRKGQEISGFLIERPIGKGGMSELYLAKDKVLKRPVVIKVLSNRFAQIEDFKRHFMKEAQIQANLDNPHIVQILSIFNHQKHLCLVMQHIEGIDLDKIIKKAKTIRKSKREKGALSIERSVHIFIQVLEGIGFIHKYRVIHGDIKPANILLDEQGRVRIVDFGLSFLLSDQNGGESPDILQGGTPHYISPEQILNEKIDTRSDIYSLGVTLFHMITGQFPHRDIKKINDLVEFHIAGKDDYPKELLDEYPQIPSETKAAILKALSKDPDQRHHSCLEFSLAIKEGSSLEMYSELLRLSLVTKKNLSSAERAYLKKISERKGLDSEGANALEDNIREEMGLSATEIAEEYNNPDGQEETQVSVVRPITD